MKEETKRKYFGLADEWLHNGERATTAYLKFYPGAARNTAGVNSHKILNQPDVKEYIAARRVEIQAEAEARHGITRYTLIDDQKEKKELLRQLFELAIKDNLDPIEEEKFKRISAVIRTADVNKADEILIKMLGLFESEKIDIKSDGEKIENIFMIGGKEVKF
tara:strand:+ start:22690 stop:23178 length:489 start_codon:yes stop_codon:yes gene_type:complete